VGREGVVLLSDFFKIGAKLLRQGQELGSKAAEMTRSKVQEASEVLREKISDVTDDTQPGKSEVTAPEAGIPETTGVAVAPNQSAEKADVPSGGNLIEKHKMDPASSEAKAWQSLTDQPNPLTDPAITEITMDHIEQLKSVRDAAAQRLKQNDDYKLVEKLNALLDDLSGGEIGRASCRERV